MSADVARLAFVVGLLGCNSLADIEPGSLRDDDTGALRDGEAGEQSDVVEGSPPTANGTGWHTTA